MGDALIAAAGEAGIRITLLDTCYLAGGLTGEGHTAPDAVQQRFSDGSVGGWLDRMSLRTQPRAATARVGAAVHSVRAVPKPSLEEVGAWVEGQPIHVHLSEQPAENIACEMFYGCSPTELLADTGVLRPDVTAVHATHVSARRRQAARGGGRAGVASARPPNATWPTGSAPPATSPTPGSA